jgi:ATP-binding cassette, subfamily B, bacterial
MLPRTPLRFILYFARQQWVKFSVVILAGLAWAINDAFFPFFLKQIVNHLHRVSGSVFSSIQTPLFLLILFRLVVEVFLRLQGMVQIFIFPKLRATIRTVVFDYVRTHSHQYFSSHFSGSLSRKLNVLPTSCQTIIEIIALNCLTPACGAAIILVMLWLNHPVFAVILLIWLFIHFGLTSLLLARGNALWKKQADAASVLGGKIVDIFTNIFNVRLFASGRYELDYLKKYQDDEISKSKKAMWYTEILRLGLSLNGLFLIFGMLLTLVYGYSAGWVTLGDFTQVMMQASYLLEWIWFVSYQLTVFSREIGTINDALSLIRASHDIRDKPDALPIKITRGEIFFDDVCFGYHDAQGVFNHFTLKIPSGEKVGLVGFSGSGKTSFVNLILRLYEINSGKILIDGQDISCVTQDSLRAQIAMIPQEPSLFHRSIMENIRYGCLDASDDDVFRASKLAHCHEFIEQLHGGYAALVGERGIKLSGGQRQRIAIARAILKNAPILILDEATAALDSITERLIQNSLNQLMQGRTTIVIAHRLSTLADMDRILVFYHGQIVEQGTQASLLSAGGHFAKLWHSQSHGFLQDNSEKMLHQLI